MPTNDLIASLIFKLNENQLAIAAAVEHLSTFAKKYGSDDVAANVCANLTTLDENLEFITRGVAKLMND